MEKEKSPLTVGIEQKMSTGELILFAVQHLMGITFLLVVPGLIGSACGLNSADIGYLVQVCFMTAGFVTVLQIVALGCMFLPQDFVEMLPSAVQSIVTQPMLVGIILLVIMNMINNMLLRPLYEKNEK